MMTNLLIVGAQRSATTTLAMLLSEHPHVFYVSKSLWPKHPLNNNNIFDDPIGVRRGYFDYVKASYGKMYRGQKIILEKNPNWIYDSQASARIFLFDKTIRMICVFRKQSARAFSHYRHSLKNGREGLSFPDAIKAEPERKRKYSTGDMKGAFEAFWSYMDRGNYLVQVQRYLKFFPRAQILFISFDDISKDPLRIARQLYDFAGIDSDFAPDTSKRYNESTLIPRSMLVQRISYTANLAAQRQNRVGTLFKRFIRRHNLKPGNIEPDPATLQFIDDQFREQNVELSKITGISLNG